jgi:hypothetical protein
MSPLCPRSSFPASCRFGDTAVDRSILQQGFIRPSRTTTSDTATTVPTILRLREIALRQCSKRTTAAQRALPGLRGSASGRSAKGRKKNGTLRKRTASRKTSRMSRAFQPRASKNPTPAAGANFKGALARFSPIPRCIIFKMAGEETSRSHQRTAGRAASS